MSALTEQTICDQCGNERPPYDADKRCAVCAADWNGYAVGRRFATLLHLGYAVERVLEEGDVTPDQVRATVTLALAGQLNSDDVQSITEGIDVCPSDWTPGDDHIDGMLNLVWTQIHDAYEVVKAARRAGQPIDKRLLSRRLHAASAGLGGGQWLKRRSEED
jgi:hypothetical protein